MSDEDEDELPEIAGELVRLNKYLADQGVASRRRCDEMIAKGKVSVDGEPCTVLGTKVDPTKQVIEVDGFRLKPDLLKKRYYLLNKPKGVVCTNEVREARLRAIDLITDPRAGRIYTVGRLDEESQGLIMLTNDGDWANLIMHPSHGVPKTYWVKLRGRIDDAALEEVRRGVHLSEGKTGAMELSLDRRGRESSSLYVTLREGKNREVRRVFAHVGFKVMQLRRVRIGNLTDRRLHEGDWRPLTKAEVDDLRALAVGSGSLDTLHGGYARPRVGFSKARGPRRPKFKPRPPGAGFKPRSRPPSAGFKPRSRPPDAGFKPRSRPPDAGFKPRSRPPDAGFKPRSRPQGTGASTRGEGERRPERRSQRRERSRPRGRHERGGRGHAERGARR